MLAFFVASLSFFPKNDPYARTWYEHVVDVGNVEVEYTVRAPAYVDMRKAASLALGTFQEPSRNLLGTFL